MIAVVGEALIDAHVDGDLLHAAPGGGPFNTAVTLGCHGVPVTFVGALSYDRFGRQLEETLSAAGVDTAACPRVTAPTPIAIVDESTGQPSYTFYLAGTAHEALTDEPLQDLSSDVATIHVGTLVLATDPPASAVAAWVEGQAPRRVVIVDPNVRPALVGRRDAYVRRLERLIGLADLVKLSDEDIGWIYPGVEDADVAELLLGYGAGCVVVTRGADGAEGWTIDGSAAVPARPVEGGVAVGAGDAFGAGLLDWLWRADRLDKETIRRLGSDELDSLLTHAAATAATHLEGTWRRSSSIT